MKVLVRWASGTSSSATTGSVSRWPPVCAGAELPEGVRVEDFGIRGVHLAYELLDGYDALVLVDAVPMGRAARDGGAHRTGPRAGDVGDDDGPTPAMDAHSMNPAVVLGMLPLDGRRRWVGWSS